MPIKYNTILWCFCMHLLYIRHISWPTLYIYTWIYLLLPDLGVTRLSVVQLYMVVGICVKPCYSHQMVRHLGILVEFPKVLWLAIVFFWINLHTDVKINTKHCINTSLINIDVLFYLLLPFFTCFLDNTQIKWCCIYFQPSNALACWINFW